MTRSCGSCHLCCRLPPIKETGKPSGVLCEHYRKGRGCMIYEKRPVSCRAFVCRWLINDDAEGLPRPDQGHYYVDMVPDFVTINGEQIRVVEIWADPAYPKCHRDPRLLAYLLRRAKEKVLGLVRHGPGAGQAFLMVPSGFLGNGTADWLEVTGNCEAEHSAADKLRAWGIR